MDEPMYHITREIVNPLDPQSLVIFHVELLDEDGAVLGSVTQQVNLDGIIDEDLPKYQEKLGEQLSAQVRARDDFDKLKQFAQPRKEEKKEEETKSLNECLGRIEEIITRPVVVMDAPKNTEILTELAKVGSKLETTLAGVGTLNATLTTDRGRTDKDQRQRDLGLTASFAKLSDLIKSYQPEVKFDAAPLLNAFQDVMVSVTSLTERLDALQARFDEQTQTNTNLELADKVNEMIAEFKDQRVFVANSQLEVLQAVREGSTRIANNVVDTAPVAIMGSVELP